MKYSHINTFIFDIGNVLIKCGAIYLLRDWMNLSSKMSEEILKTALHPDWVGELDLGKPFDVALEERIKVYPEYEKYLQAYIKNWDKTIKSADEETIEIVKALLDKKYKIYALSNWPSEKYYLLAEALPILKKLDSVIISGDIGIKKPDPEVFRFLINEHKMLPENSLFIDDLKENIESASSLEFKTHQYQDAKLLKSTLKKAGIL